MNESHAREIRDNEIVRKRLAKLIALRCFRNTELENLHAGRVPSSASGDFSDVKVVSPFGEIPWTQLSRLSDSEMKSLIVDVVNQCYAFLELLYRSPRGNDLVESLKEADPLPEWDEPVSPRRP